MYTFLLRPPTITFMTVLVHFPITSFGPFWVFRCPRNMYFSGSACCVKKLICDNNIVVTNNRRSCCIPVRNGNFSVKKIELLLGLLLPNT